MAFFPIISGVRNDVGRRNSVHSCPSDTAWHPRRRNTDIRLDSSPPVRWERDARKAESHGHTYAQYDTIIVQGTLTASDAEDCSCRQEASQPFLTVAA